MSLSRFIVYLTGNNTELDKEIIDNSSLAVQSAVQFKEAADKVKDVLSRL